MRTTWKSHAPYFTSSNKCYYILVNYIVLAVMRKKLKKDSYLMVEILLCDCSGRQLQQYKWTDKFQLDIDIEVQSWYIYIYIYIIDNYNGPCQVKRGIRVCTLMADSNQPAYPLSLISLSEETLSQRAFLQRTAKTYQCIRMHTCSKTHVCLAWPITLYAASRIKYISAYMCFVLCRSDLFFWRIRYTLPWNIAVIKQNFSKSSKKNLINK